MTLVEHYMEAAFPWVAWGTLALAPLVFIVLLYIKAPYGRHVRGGWGPTLDNRLGGFLMELPAVVVFGGIRLVYANRGLTALTLL